MGEIYVPKPVINITINTAINSALPGDVVIVPDGIYNKFKQIVIPSDIDGTPESPITLKAETPGGVTFTGNCASPLIFVQGDWWIIRDFKFIDVSEVGDLHTYGIKSTDAIGTRVTNTYWEGFGLQNDIGKNNWCVWMGLMGGGRYSRIDNNTFSENGAVCIVIGPKATNCQVDHNYFKDTIGDGTNGFEGIHNAASNLIAEYNLFENMAADPETISNKGPNNTYRYNVFRSIGGATAHGIVLRGGNNCIVNGNYFFDVDKFNIRVHDTGHKIINNYFINPDYSAILLAEGGEDYANVSDILIANNTIVNPILRGIDIGWWPGGDVKPNNLAFKNNIIISDVAESYLIRDGGHTGTFVWKNNLHYATGSANYWLNNGGGGEPGTGITHANPNLTTGYGIYRLQASSVNAINQGTPDINVTDDIDGQLRHEIPDIGCDEYYNLPPIRLPVTTKDVGVSWLRPIDLCEGMVCDNVCIGDDLWSQKCVEGDCIPDQLLESNSVTCGYDPCEGVVCDNICIGLDLWSQKCEGGYCVPDQLLESNSVTCGYDPCEGVVCDNICIGLDLWSQKCEGGYCVPDQLLESNSVTCELCEGVVCGNTCVGDDLWSQSCDPDTGNCVPNQLIQQNSINCKIPDRVPSEESTIKTYLMLGGFGLMGLAMLILRKK